ncbi:TPA: TetR/AcrR family transcriptional regulator, partial [Streptococcus agalactiae]|nr:TetR/AcrR family transcriptional regulator [Streptococcus agalactiae]
MANQDISITPRLLENAKKEFKRNGFEKTSLNVICKNAGITTGALYKRFSTKEDLFNSLVEKPANRLKEFLDKEHRDYKKLPKEEQINCVF